LWRALAPALAGLVLLAMVPVVYGLRFDRGAVGAVLLWGGSVLQVAMGLWLVARALAETIPGRLSGSGALVRDLSIGLLAMVALTVLTFAASPTHVPGAGGARYFEVCLTRSAMLGLLPLAVCAALLARGILMRPAATGALAGLGAGLFADSSWRLYCEVSDPAHVLTAHLGAVALVTVAGIAAVLFASRLRP
jgi:hypothetical protein